MKITDPQVILDGEKDLIASVQRDLDLDAVRDLLKERLTVTAISPKGGQIVVHDNNVAFRLDYEINLNGSLLFDRQGNLLDEDEAKAQPDEEVQQGSDLDNDLSIDLPDYDQEDEAQPGQAQADSPAAEHALDDVQPEIQDEIESRVDPEIQEDTGFDIQDAEPGLEIEDLDDESALDQDDPDFSADISDADIEPDIEPEDTQTPGEPEDDSSKADEIQDLSVGELTGLELEDDDNTAGQDSAEDDITDILQESRDFWEKKKDY